MKLKTVVCGLAAVLTACLSLWAGRTHEAWAQTKPAATEAPAPLLVRARGAWSPTVNYVLDDLVTSRGSAWRAKRANINKIPGQTSPSTALDWERFARGFNPLGTWLSSKTYQPDDLVLLTGSTWRALRTNLNVTPGTSGADWQKFAAMGATGPAGGNSVANGSQGTPSINFASDHSTGIFSPSAGKIAMSAGGQLFLHNIGSGNTALGAGALDSNTTGGFNTALGTDALTSNADGNSNTAFGNSALSSNTAGSNNIAVGMNALLNNTTGEQNTAVGASALATNSTGGFNTAMASNALTSNTNGTNNVAIGLNALSFNSTGSANTAVGRDALAANTTADDNTALGRAALKDNTTGTANVAIGNFALQKHTSGNGNVAVGLLALFNDTVGTANTAVGTHALSTNGAGAANTAVGQDALNNNTTGGNNAALGFSALFANDTGANNTAIGVNALSANVAGGSNIAVGSSAGVNPTGPASSIFIGNSGLAADTTTIKIGTQGTQTTAFVAGIAGATVANSATVLINTATGQLGTVVSSRRYKEDIAPMADASAALMKLRPVTFRYKQPYIDGPKPREYGLIAEEVAEVLPDLAVFNEDGAPETVKYHLLPSLLLNEVQGQQRTIERQEQTIRSQAEQIAALERRLNSLEAAVSRPGSAAGIRRASLMRTAP